ncbi:MAG TPA: DsrH/TusB family sulfur metabolism protein [Nitrospirota bacterium]
MIVMIKSAPDTADGARGLTLAKEGGADIVLLQNGIYFAQKDRIGGFSGTVYVLDDDKRLRGLKDAEVDASVKAIGYDQLTDLMMQSDKVVGMF